MKNNLTYFILYVKKKTWFVEKIIKTLEYRILNTQSIYKPGKHQSIIYKLYSTVY